MTSPTRPLRRDAERNRQRILAAAGELFAERGLSVTLDDIARHAGVGVGTVYRRFPDKNELIDALFEDRLKALCAAAEAALASDDPWDGLVLFLERGVA
jgi:AcrR family transcriptional regulator